MVPAGCSRTVPIPAAVVIGHCLNLQGMLHCFLAGEFQQPWVFSDVADKTCPTTLHWVRKVDCFHYDCDSDCSRLGRVFSAVTELHIFALGEYHLKDNKIESSRR
jgi:hypothetical protein